MSYPVWPAELTKFDRSGWQAQPQEARQRRQSDAGPPAYRRRFSAVARLVALSIVVTRNERAIFDRFHADTCAHGAHLFWMPDPTTDGWPLLHSDGRPLQSAGTPLLLSARWLCSFGDQVPAAVIVEQVKFRISFNVVVMP